MYQQQSTDLIGNRTTRSPSEIIFKRTAILTSSVIAADHLSTLRRQDNADAILAVIGLILIPTLPLATLLVNSWRSLWSVYSGTGGRLDVVYFLSAALGVRATWTIKGTENDDAESVALVDVAYSDLVRLRRTYDIRWLGRLVVLLLVATQAITTVVLVERRLLCGSFGGTGRAAMSWDIYNGMVAVGAVGTAVGSIGITILNTSWRVQVQAESPEETRTNHNTAWRVSAALLDAEVITNEVSVIEFRTARLLYMILSVVSAWQWLDVRPRVILVTILGTPGSPGYAQGTPTKFVVTVCQIVIFFVPITFLFAGSVGRITQIRDSVYFQKGSSMVLLAFRTFLLAFWMLLNICCLLALVKCMICSAEERSNLIVSRRKGLWLDIMWVDPWAERLYAF